MLSDIGYYFTASNEMDSLAKELNCLQNPLYFCLKNEVTLTDLPFELFLVETSFYVETREDRRFLRGINQYSSWSSKAFDIVFHQGAGTETFKRDIAPLLQSGKIVPFQTHTPRVPYFYGYDNPGYPFDPAVDKPGHVFVAVDYDAGREVVTYLEAPWLLHSGNFRPLGSNRTLGQITLAELAPAFECFLNYLTVTVNLDLLQETCTGGTITPLIQEIVGNRDLPRRHKDGVTYLYNADSLEKLADMCRRNEIGLNERTEPYADNLCKVMEWKLNDIRRTKSLLLNSLKRHQGKLGGSSVRHLSATLESNERSWLYTIMMLRKMLLLQKYPESAVLAAPFMRMAESEKALYESMNAFLADA
ncbi:hypothetical protein [Sorangium sp. So ce1151]|uniref:hypothetical protein n=1 Tax=Sorangium sp. So ce1151 TaxID=3133332 RepID=UPI003F63F1F7